MRCSAGSSVLGGGPVSFLSGNGSHGFGAVEVA